jgi:hypothetical protein
MGNTLTTHSTLKRDTNKVAQAARLCYFSIKNTISYASK